MSLLALHYLATGVASIFFSLIPVYFISFPIYLHREHVLLSLVGAAVTGLSFTDNGCGMDEKKADSLGINGFVYKPIAKKDLAELIQKILNIC